MAKHLESLQGSQESPFFGTIRQILGDDKIMIINCEGYVLRLINGSIGNDYKNGEFFNVEIDFEDHTENYRVYPFGVNRIRVQGLGYNGVSRLGASFGPGSSLSYSQPNWHIRDRTRVTETVYGFIKESALRGSVERFVEAKDFRKTLSTYSTPGVC